MPPDHITVPGTCELTSFRVMLLMLLYRYIRESQSYMIRTGVTKESQNFTSCSHVLLFCDTTHYHVEVSNHTYLGFHLCTHVSLICK